LQTAVPSLPTLLEPFVTPKFTTIVLIQNGIGIEDQVAERWPDNTIISCIVRIIVPYHSGDCVLMTHFLQTWVGASQPQPGIIEHSNGLETTLGLFDPPKRSVAFDGHQQENLINLVKMLQAGGADVHEKEDIQTERWKKVIWYGPFLITLCRFTSCFVALGMLRGTL
jgi:2-dehydropantoate 2-reductase